VTVAIGHRLLGVLGLDPELEHIPRPQVVLREVPVVAAAVRDVEILVFEERFADDFFAGPLRL